MKISDIYPELENFLLSFKGVENDFKQEWGWTRFMVKGKMFCAFCADETEQPLVTVKSEPDYNELMRSQFKDLIIPGYYMNKTHWNSIKPCEQVPYPVVQEMCQGGYNLILNSLSKKARQEILENN